MKFSKWQGLGNDFIIVEPASAPGFDFKAASRHLCDRHFGIGADGVVTVRKLETGGFEMRIYNADGTEPEMCGNATRCVGLYIHRRKLAPGNSFELHTLAGTVRPCVLENQSVRVDMGLPRLLRKDIPVSGVPDSPAQGVKLEVPGRALDGVCVSMGNPHCVIFVPDIKSIELEKWGRAIETDPQFPAGTNVEFVEVISPQLVRMRVWERGCGVTLACGTGSCATGVAGFITGRTSRHVSVLLDGGELEIEYSETDGRVYMTGPAQEVFNGEYIGKF
ncbi:MAG: diaminopimelate epimerase [Victivallaceae bacterium]|nr:diaminopimelate epimerase [Victivallaceae bacterium]